MNIFDSNIINTFVNDFIHRSGYRVVQENGQRICSRPGSGRYAKPQPGSEVFIGNLPRYVFENDIIPVFEKVGPIFKVRLMMEFRGCNRGFAFVEYYQPEHALRAVAELNGFEFRPGVHVGVTKSLNNCRLFISGIPLTKTRDEVWNGLNSHVDGMVDIIMYSSRENKALNRGYVFAEFETHKHATIARKILSHVVLLWDVQLIVDWADIIPYVDPAIMARVKKLFIRNISMRVNNRDLWNFIIKFVPPSNVAKVSKTLDYAFVHFDTRASAEYALTVLNGKQLEDTIIEVSWARPRIYSKEFRLNNPPENTCRSVPPRMRRKLTDATNKNTRALITIVPKL